MKFTTLLIATLMSIVFFVYTTIQIETDKKIERIKIKEEEKKKKELVEQQFQMVAVKHKAGKFILDKQTGESKFYWNDEITSDTVPLKK